MDTIPLFPLSAVLYPRMPLPLHVFEPRYQEMVRDCSASGDRFGVVAIREGAEVGPAALPYRTGTLASVERVVRRARGRSHLLVTGRRRFAIVRLVDGRSYPQAEVEYLEDGEPDAACLLLASQAREAFARYVRSLARLSATPLTSARLPEDPVLLSWTIASGLMVELPRKQALLEESRVGWRLRRELAMIQSETLLLDHQLANRVQINFGYGLN